MKTIINKIQINNGKYYSELMSTLDENEKGKLKKILEKADEYQKEIYDALGEK